MKMAPAEKAVTCVTVGRLIQSTALIPAASTACCLGLSPAIRTLYHENRQDEGNANGLYRRSGFETAISPCSL